MPLSSNRYSSLTLLTCAAMAGCAMAPNAMLLPLQTAWYEGRQVHYVTTDVSDAEVALAKGANFVPRLKDLLPGAAATGHRPGSPLERVYAFVNSAQPTVFPSVPRPVGPASRDLGYSPLWRMVKVVWQPGIKAAELKSEEEVLRAEDRGEVQLIITDVVLNCPVAWVEGDAPLRGVKLVRDNGG